jgi:hypothetical protein
MINHRVAAWVIGVALAFALAVGRAFGADVDTIPRPNNLGVTETIQNENTYLLAIPISVRTGDGFTTVHFQPYATPLMFDQKVVFCRNVGYMFTGRPMVATYRTQATIKYQGDSCHELISVFEVKGDR